jgi:SAM-dependent methyltransferase
MQIAFTDKSVGKIVKGLNKNCNKYNIMHPERTKFTLFVKQILADFFIQKIVLNVGPDHNNRFLFDNDCEYHSNDDISSPTELPFRNNTFDTIIFNACIEPDSEYRDSFIKIYNMLKPDGLFCFTCTSTCRDENGTFRNINDMSNYYKTFTELHLNEALPLNNSFTVWETYYNPCSNDLYFVGIKKGNIIFEPLIKYENNGFVNTSSNINF